MAFVIFLSLPLFTQAHFPKPPQFSSFPFSLHCYLVTLIANSICENISFSWTKTEEGFHMSHVTWCLPSTENSTWAQSRNLLCQGTKCSWGDLQGPEMLVISTVLSLVLHFLALPFSEFVLLSASAGGGLGTKSCPTPVTPWTASRQAPLSMGFSRWVYWCGLPFPSPVTR